MKSRAGYKRKRGQLYVMVGPPLSGKTHTIWNHWHLLFGEDTVIPSVVSPDIVRQVITGQQQYKLSEELVWSHIGVMIRALIEGGTDAVLDSTNLRVYQRRKWRQYDPIYIVMDTPMEVALGRVPDDSDRLEQTVRDSYAAFEPFTPNEGIVIRCKGI